MTNCAKCGQCCAAIRIAATKKQLREANTNTEDKTFILQHWHRISRSTAEKRVPGIVEGEAAYYDCDKYDAESHLCTAHEERPPICRNFPWYGGKPGAGEGLRPFTKCSFWADVPSIYWLRHVDPLPSPPDEVGKESVL